MSVRVWDPGQAVTDLAIRRISFWRSPTDTIFEGVIASTISDVLWTDSGEPQRLRGIAHFNTFQVMACLR